MVSLDYQMRKPVQVARSSLYYGQYQYAILVLLNEASFLRNLNHDRIDEAIRYRNEWMGRRTIRHVIPQTTQQNLHDMCDFLLNRAHDYKKVVQGNGLWLYTNQLTDFVDLGNCPGAKILYVNQACVSLTPNAVTLSHPKHLYRTYFRDRWLGNEELAVLRRYFDSRPDMFRLGPGFKKLVQGKRMWMAANHFVDHNEPNADFLINMAVPGIVRKTLPIVARDK